MLHSRIQQTTTKNTNRQYMLVELINQIQFSTTEQVSLQIFQLSIVSVSSTSPLLILGTPLGSRPRFARVPSSAARGLLSPSTAPLSRVVMSSLRPFVARPLTSSPSRSSCAVTFTGLHWKVPRRRCSCCRSSRKGVDWIETVWWAWLTRGMTTNSPTLLCPV